MRSHSVEETADIARGFAEAVSSAAPQGAATVVGLRGDLGSGKTTFAQAFARALGVSERVASPTFVLLKRYPLSGHPRFENLIHIDAYRLEQADELRALGWETLSADPTNVILVEWPERVAEALPAEAHTIDFAFVDDTVREIMLPISNFPRSESAGQGR